jgi:DNA-binding response OmpR family regulator
MDWHMPKMDGLAAAKIIWAKPKVCKTPIVMLSADALSEQKKVAYSVGIQEYLTKPLDFMKLFNVLVKYLRQDKIRGAKKSCLPLPENLEKQLVEKFKKLSECSILDAGELVDKIAKMQMMCQGFDSPYSKVLIKIEDAVFNGDEEEFNYLLKNFNRKQ